MALPLIMVALLGTGCESATPSGAAPTEGTATASHASTPGAGTQTPMPTATQGLGPRPTPPDLSARPLVWFAPLPPLSIQPTRPFIGSEDFMQLFAPEAAWGRAASRIGVFKLYGEWVAYGATDQELRTVVADLARRGIPLAVEAGPLTPPPDCGHGVEGFAGIDEGRRIARRIEAAGGTLQILALDEPYYFAHLYDGPNACQWPVERIAQGVATFVREMRAEWPDLIVGDTEPMPGPVTPAGLAEWLDAYRAAAGEPFAFLHLDMDWSRTNWPALGRRVEAAGDERGVPIGMIYNGGGAATDEQWLGTAGRRILAYEVDGAGTPEHVLFQSWMDKPDFSLPEDGPATFTALVNRYFDDRPALGQDPGGPDNLALGRPATASSALDGTGPARAVDGDPDTNWSSGAGPPGWIEVELGRAATLAEVRLLVSQFPEGRTHHRLRCLTRSGDSSRIGDLVGQTSELEVLTFRLDAPRTCRILRIDTLTSPSWVAWREIEAYGP